MPEIKVTTSADLKGIHSLQSEMSKVLDQSKQIRDLWKEANGYMRSGGSSGGNIGAHSGGNEAAHGQIAVGGGIAPPPRNPAAQAMQGGTQASRARVGSASTAGANMTGMPNLGTTQGLVSWYQNVYAEAAPMLRGLGGGNSRGGIANLGGVRYQGRPVQSVTQTVAPSATQMQHWFHGLANQMDSMDMETKLAYWAAGGQGGRYTGRSGPTLAMQDFIDQYGGGLGAPTAQTVSSLVPVSQTRGQRFLQHFMNNRGSGLRGSLIGGLKGGLAGSAVDALMGGGEAGAAGGLMAGGGMGALMGGGLVAGGVGALVAGIVSWVGGAVKQGMQTYSNTASQFSALSHSLGDLTVSLGKATQSSEGFREATLRAGAVTGMNAAQTTQVVSTLAQAFGNKMGNRGLTNLTRQAGAFAMTNGLTPSQAASISALGATLGITSGTGSSLNPTAFNGMMMNMAQQGGMLGRQGSAMTGLMSVYSSLGAVNPILSNPQGTAGIYTQMSASGIQGLQGASGANILSSLNSGFGSGGGLGGILGFSSIYAATHGKISNPIQMLSIEEQGLGGRIPGTHLTYGQTLSGQINKMSGGSLYSKALLLSQAGGVSINQALAFLKTGAMSAGSLSIVNHQKQNLTVPDRNAIAKAVVASQASKLGAAIGGLKAAIADVAGVPTQMTLHGPGGNIYVRGGHGHSSGTPLTNPIGSGGVTSSVPSTLGASQRAFIKAVLPAAKTVSKKTGYPVVDLISEWAYETGWGTSTAAKKNANLAGIIPFGPYKAGLDSTYAGFKNLQQFAQADATVLNEPRYAGARKLAQSGASAQKIFATLDMEGYTGSTPATPPSMYGAGVQADYQTVKIASSSIAELAHVIVNQMGNMPTH